MIFCKCLFHSFWQREEKLLVLDPLNPQHVAKVGAGNTRVLLEVLCMSCNVARRSLKDQ